MAENDSIENFHLRTIISKIGTASYHLAKHLTKLLSPLSHSEFTLKNTKAFIQEFKNMLPSDVRLYHQYHFEAELLSEGIRNKDIEKRNGRSFATMYQKRTFFL